MGVLVFVGETAVAVGVTEPVGVAVIVADPVAVGVTELVGGGVNVADAVGDGGV